MAEAPTTKQPPAPKTEAAPESKVGPDAKVAAVLAQEHKSGADVEKVAASIASLSDEDKAVLLAALGVPDAERARIARLRMEEANSGKEEVPLYKRAGVYPVHVDATTEMTGKEAASKAGVDFDDVIGYAVRCPVNVDNQPIKGKQVLTVALVDGSKVAVELGD